MLLVYIQRIQRSLRIYVQINWKLDGRWVDWGWAGGGYTLFISHSSWSSSSPLAGALFINKKDEANVGRHVNHVGREALVKSAQSFVPPRLSDYIQDAGVVSVLILQTGSHNLIRIRSSGRKQFRHGCKWKIFPGTLQKNEVCKFVNETLLTKLWKN